MSGACLLLSFTCSELTPAHGQAALGLELHFLSAAQSWCFWISLARVSAGLAVQDDVDTTQVVSDASSSPGAAAAIAQVSNRTIPQCRTRARTAASDA